MRCASPGNERRPAWIAAGSKPERQRRRRGAGGVLRIVQPAQRADAADLCNLRSLPLGGAHDPLLLDIKSLGQRPPHRNSDHALAGPLQPIGDRPAPFVIDANDSGSSLRHAGDQAFLHLRVVLHGAVTIEMIFAEVDQDADRGIERGSEIDLIGRTFDDVNAVRPGGVERQDRGADIAAELRVHAGRCREMRDQRRGGRFAVGAGDGDKRRIRRDAAALAAEQLDIADHFDAGFLRKLGPPNAAPDG